VKISRPSPSGKAGQRLDKEAEDLVGEIEAHRKGQQQRYDAAHQPLAQLDQVVEQRRLCLVEVLQLDGHFYSPAFAASGAGAAAAGFGRCRCRCSSRRRCGSHRGCGTRCGCCRLCRRIGSRLGRFRRATIGMHPHDLRSFCSFHFFSRSSISASRTMASRPAEVADILRALPIQRPAWRSAAGMSLGPITTIATMATSNISDAPISNTGACPAYWPLVSRRSCRQQAGRRQPGQGLASCGGPSICAAGAGGVWPADLSSSIRRGPA
jgi:hypothetical protein